MVHDLAVHIDPELEAGVDRHGDVIPFLAFEPVLEVFDVRVDGGYGICSRPDLHLEGWRIAAAGVGVSLRDLIEPGCRRGETDHVAGHRVRVVHAEAEAERMRLPGNVAEREFGVDMAPGSERDRLLGRSRRGDETQKPDQDENTSNVKGSHCALL